MTSPSATPGRELPAKLPHAHHVEVVWGAPSAEMLEAEARGDIILVEDIYRSSPPRGDSGDHNSRG